MEGTVDQQKIDAARAKLRERMGEARPAGKGVPRRKKRPANKPSAGDEKKVGCALKRLGVTNIPGIEEVSMLLEDGKSLRFTNPKVQAAPNANTYVLTGQAEEHFDPAEILQPMNSRKMSPEVLKKLADSLQNRLGDAKICAEDDDDVPDVGNFEEAAESAS